MNQEVQPLFEVDAMKVVVGSTPDPEVAAAVLNDTLPPDLTLFELAVDPPALCDGQWSRIEGMMHRSCIESCR